MAVELSGERAAEALSRIGALIEEVYPKDKPDFVMEPEERARLEYTLSDFVRYVQAHRPSDEPEVMGKVKENLGWLWGVVLSHSIPIRRHTADHHFDDILRDVGWIEEMVREESVDVPTTQCGHCGQVIPGTGFALCSRCQLDGYRECRHCEQRVATTINPYCDVCAEEIVGAG